MRLIKKMELPYDVDRASTYADALKRFGKCKYDIVLLDYLLPDGTGLELLEKIKGVPVIFLTGSEDARIAVTAMKGGAYDYLIKDPDFEFLELLPVSIERTLQSVMLQQEHHEYEERIVRQNEELERLNTELARMYEETKRLSLHDPLTGLANRRFLEIELDRNFAMAKRYETPLSIIMMDIDHFKRYNDTCGHPAGDKLLADIARLAQKGSRGVDLVARYGGEEFFILLPDTDLKGAQVAAERIRRTVQEGTEVTVSLGIASYNKGMEKKEELICPADNALYKAKENGRNRVEISEEGIKECRMIMVENNKGSGHA